MHDHAPIPMSGPVCGSASILLWCTTWAQAAAHGIDLQTIATLIGAIGTTMFAGVAVSREYRAHMDRKAGTK
jgi:hypothetical protein